MVEIENYASKTYISGMGLDSDADFKAMEANMGELAERAGKWRREDALKEQQKAEELKAKTEAERARMEGLLNDVTHLYLGLNELKDSGQMPLSDLQVNNEKWSLTLYKPVLGEMVQGVRTHEASIRFHKHPKDGEVDHQKPQNEEVTLVVSKKQDEDYSIQMKEGAKPWTKVNGRMGKDGLEDPKFTPGDLASNPDNHKSLPLSLDEVKGVVDVANQKVKGMIDTQPRK